MSHPTVVSTPTRTDGNSWFTSLVTYFWSLIVSYSDDPRYYSAARAQNDGATSAAWRTTLNDDDEELALLPPTTHGWSFVAKKWGEILVEDLSPVPFQPHIFNHLVLREDYKSLIRSLVDAHAGRGNAALLTDVVTGKGGGLVIVLHGKPGKL